MPVPVGRVRLDEPRAFLWGSSPECVGESGLVAVGRAEPAWVERGTNHLKKRKESIPRRFGEWWCCS